MYTNLPQFVLQLDSTLFLQLNNKNIFNTTTWKLEDDTEVYCSNRTISLVPVFTIMHIQWRISTWINIWKNKSDMSHIKYGVPLALFFVLCYFLCTQIIFQRVHHNVNSSLLRIDMTHLDRSILTWKKYPYGSFQIIS